MYNAIYIFDREISTYSLAAVLGAAVTVVYCVLQSLFTRKNARIKLLPQEIFYMLLLMGIGVIIGAKLMYIFTSIEFTVNNDISFWENISVWAVQIASGGLVFYGGLIGAIAVAMFYVLHFKAPVSELLDIAFAGIPLFHFFGRIGCFLSGCCYGKEYHGIFAVVFPEGNFGNAPPGVELFPVQLMEAALNLLLWIVLTAVYRKTSRLWLTSGLYLLSYGIMRFLLEFLRGDEVRGHIGTLSSSQFISIFIVALGVLLIVKPSWLERFGSMNNAAYAESVKVYKKRVAEYKEYKAAKKLVRSANGKKF